MSARRIAALLPGFLVVALLANAAVKNNTMRIKVLDSETHSVSQDDGGVPKNCDGANFDAYCHNSRAVLLTNTLLVQDGNGAAFRIACNVESRWSRCVPLPKGQTFDAKREKHGVTVYYADGSGKARSQLYALVEADTIPAPVVPVSTQTVAKVSEDAAQTSAGAVAPVTPSSLPATVKCNFTSTPVGAEVTVDGRYVGSTPSVLGVTTGSHVIVISMPGFAQWKRDLAVSSGADLTVNAVLQKAQ